MVSRWPLEGSYAGQSCEDQETTGSHPVPGEGNGTPLQYFCLENPMDGGAWWAAVHGVAKSWIWLSDFTFTLCFHALEKEMATRSSVLALRIPGTVKPGWAGVYGVSQSWTRLKRLSNSSSILSQHLWEDKAMSADLLSHQVIIFDLFGDETC